MAEPHDFSGSTHHYGPPPGMDESECGWLHCFLNGQCVVSAWKPSKEHLKRLNAGESIWISVWSGMSVFPVFVGSESEVAGVVSDTGKIWNKNGNIE